MKKFNFYIGPYAKTSMLIVAFLTVSLMFLGYIGVSLENNKHVDVEGTVFAKGTTIEYHRHHTDGVFVFAIKPDNPDYHKFDVKVDFSTYSSYNVGDRIKFYDIAKWTVGDKSFSIVDEIVSCLVFSVGIILIFVWFIAVCMMFNFIFSKE